MNIGYTLIENSLCTGYHCFNIIQYLVWVFDLTVIGIPNVLHNVHPVIIVELLHVFYI